MQKEDGAIEKPPKLERNVRILNVTTFLSGIQRMAVNVILQPFALSLVPSIVFVGLLQGIGGFNGLVTTIVQPVSGWISDRRGRKRLIVLGSIFAAASLLLFSFAGFVGAAFLLVPSAVLMGLAALRNPAESSVVAESVKKESRGYTYSLIALAMSVPGIFAPYLGGLAADKLGFASVFLAVALVEGCSLTLLFFCLKETRENKKKGSLNLDEFTRFLRRIVAPPHRLRGIYVISALDAVMWGFGGYILTGLLSKNFGFTSAQLGLLSTVSSISWALFQVPVGWLVQKRGCKIPLILSEASGIIAMIGFALSTSFESFFPLRDPLWLGYCLLDTCSEHIHS